MSKIGRKPIALGKIQVDVKGQEVHVKGAKHSGVQVLPDILTAVVRDGSLVLMPKEGLEKKTSRRGELNQVWGLQRALLSNKIHGANADFEKKLQIVGLGFKAALSGGAMVFSLGYSHKIDFALPNGVSVDIDKTGQFLTFKSSDKELLGHVCSMVRALRLPEPYKGTGIKLATEVIARKAGKTKAAAA
jgi:large subunit ribosomal protein L6